MTGLLYKDFTSIRGKKLVFILFIATASFLLLRLMFPGTREIPSFMAVDNTGSPVNLIDTFFVFACAVFLIEINYVINKAVSTICRTDEKNKIRGFLFSCPLKKNTYIASKYTFIGIMTYVFLSLYMIWSVSCNAFVVAGNVNEDLLSLFNSFAVTFFSLSLLLAGIELSMFLLLGRDRAMLIKIGIIMFVAMLMIGYLLFGNLIIFENIDFDKITAWANAHVFEIMLMNILSPIIAVLLYYGSYRLTTAIYERKEREYD